MKVLWFSVTPSLYDETKYGGWIASLEKIVANKSDNIELAIAFEYNDDQFKVIKNAVTYYPMNISNSVKDRMVEKIDLDYRWERVKAKMYDVIDDYKPDLIQCFGSEWPYGLIAEHVGIPVVVHMQGFANIYNESVNIAFSTKEYIRCNRYNPKVIFTTITNKRKYKEDLKRESRLMRVNKFFLGRTEWDKSIVKHYNPNATYFYCSEALRTDIYEKKGKWNINQESPNKLITITQAGVLKGNEMILRTARVLKDSFGYPFEWYVAGNKETFSLAERKVGINHKDYNIKLIGMITAEEVANELMSSTVYIHPAIIDNSPNSLCEAQLIGCPIIAANVGGISSLIKDKETGFLYPYNEPFELAFKIMDLCDNKEELSRVSKNEILAAERRHNPDSILRDLENSYQTIINNEGNK